MCLGAIGRVVRIWDENGVPMADVDYGARIEQACLLYEPDVTVDSAVLVHMGFVMEELGEERAREALALRKEIAESPPAPAEGTS